MQEIAIHQKEDSKGQMRVRMYIEKKETRRKLFTKDKAKRGNKKES